LEAEWGVFLREFNGSPIFGCGGGRNRGEELTDPEGTAEIGGKVIGQRIVFA